jgi:hypothetical protein
VRSAAERCFRKRPLIKHERTARGWQIMVTRNGRYAALHAARLQAGESVELPEAPFLHLFVARGAVALEGAGQLAEGDAARFTATGGQRVTATEAADPSLGDARHVRLSPTIR